MSGYEIPRKGRIALRQQQMNVYGLMQLHSEVHSFNCRGLQSRKNTHTVAIKLDWFQNQRLSETKAILVHVLLQSEWMWTVLLNSAQSVHLVSHYANPQVEDHFPTFLTLF